jgi:hypothetical protein
VNVGVMVDVPWPWWVTTTGAIAVALASVVAFGRVRHAAVRGALALFAAQCAVTAAVAPFLMPSHAGDGDRMTRAHRTSTADTGMGMAMGAGARREAAPSRLPFTFGFSRRERSAGDALRYGPHGRAMAAAASGSTIALTGTGGWDATSGRADGGGSYELADGSGGFERGSWRARRFVSFLQLPGSEQSLASSPPFAGRLELEITLEGRGTAILTAWSATSPEARRALGQRLDGFTLVGAGFRFTDPRPNWRTTARGEFEGAVSFFGPESEEQERR